MGNPDLGVCLEVPQTPEIVDFPVPGVRNDVRWSALKTPKTGIFAPEGLILPYGGCTRIVRTSQNGVSGGNDRGVKLVMQFWGSFWDLNLGVEASHPKCPIPGSKSPLIQGSKCP